MTRNLILATAGHVDHGKSSLVQALTGTDPDRLPEEKRRGLTIELGFAHLALEDGDVTYQLGIVDVPGHEDFVHNMVGGVGSVDLALIMVAADDGWMPQSEEHLEILSYLGVEQGIVALTKVDLLDGPAIDEREAELRERLQDSPFAAAPIVRTAVTTGEGVDALRQVLRERVRHASVPLDVGKPRLSVDRAFSIAGAGTVVTGTLAGGSLAVGQPVCVQPGGATSRVRSLQSHNTTVETCPPGTRTAINLPDLVPGKTVRRGDVIALPGLGGATSTLDVQVTMALRILELERAHVRPLNDDTRVRFHHGSANVPGTVRLLTGSPLEPGEAALAQIRLESPVFVFIGDRFILRDWQERLTMGGGIVLDPDAARSPLHAPERKRFLEAVAAQPDDIATHIRARLARDHAVATNALLRVSRFADADVEAWIETQRAGGSVVVKAGICTAAESWSRWIATATDAIAWVHERHPERMGLAVDDLRRALEKTGCPPELTDQVREEICAGDYEQAGVLVRRRGFAATLPADLRVAAGRVRAALNEKPEEPPGVGEIVIDTDHRRALQFLLDANEAVQISTELVLGIDGYDSLVAKIRTRMESGGPATVSELRKAVGLTRRVMVPLLEYLDSQGITVRQGDKRALMGKAKA